MKKIILGALLAITMASCSSDDNNIVNTNYTVITATEQPNWQVDMFSNDMLPIWSDADPTQFENSMFVLIKLQPELVPFSTDDDRMACFINNECRSIVAYRDIHEGDGSIYFALKVLGNAEDREILFEMRYYSGGLHQIFSLTRTGAFVAEQTYGINEDFVPPILLGSTKYPVQMYLSTDLTGLPFEATEMDRVAAFVGEECRGVCAPLELMTVFGYQEGEQVEIRYYSAKMNAIYTFTQKVPLHSTVVNYQAIF